MKPSIKLLIWLLFFSSPAFAGTGSAEDGFSITLILAGILAVIWGVPLLFRLGIKAWQIIRRKVQKIFSSIESAKINRIFINHF